MKYTEVCVPTNYSFSGAGCVGDQEKEWMGCFLDDLRAFGINADQWTATYYSPGRGGMAQNGRARGGTFHGEMDRCRGSQDWSTACSRSYHIICPSVTGRTKKRILISQSKSGLLVLVRSPLLTSHKWRELVLYPPGVWFADAMTSFSGITFVFEAKSERT